MEDDCELEQADSATRCLYNTVARCLLSLEAVLIVI